MIPAWLLPPKPELIGTLREHSHADEFRAARIEADELRVQKAAEVKKAEAKIRRLVRQRKYYAANKEERRRKAKDYYARKRAEAGKEPRIPKL